MALIHGVARYIVPSYNDIIVRSVIVLTASIMLNNQMSLVLTHSSYS